MARPTDYTPALAAAICRELAEGRSLVSICRDIKQTEEAKQQIKEATVQAFQ